MLAEKIANLSNDLILSAIKPFYEFAQQLRSYTDSLSAIRLNSHPCSPAHKDSTVLFDEQKVGKNLVRPYQWVIV